MIEKFITFKEPHVIEDDEVRKGGIIFRSHAVLTSGEHILISDAKHGSGFAAVDETIVFKCDEEGNVTAWDGVMEARNTRTDEIVVRINTEGLEI